MKLGRKLFYDKYTGSLLVDTGEWSNGVREKTVAEEIESYTALSERNRETFDVLELPFGAYAQDFAEGRLIGVDLETKMPKFEYINPENPTEPITTTKPLTVQIEELKAENLATMDALAEVYELILGGM